MAMQLRLDGVESDASSYASFATIQFWHRGVENSEARVSSAEAVYPHGVLGRDLDIGLLEISLNDEEFLENHYSV